MTEQDPYRAPDSQTEPNGGFVRPLSTLHALGWSILALFLLVFTFATAIALREETNSMAVVTGVLSQVIAYSLTLFLMLRVHAPEMSIKRFIGLRPTSWGLAGLGLLLGLAMQFPINGLYNLVIERFPLAEPSMLQPYYDAASAPERVVMGLAVVAIGPFIEEVLFRGALFGGLVRRVDNGPWVAIVVTAILFALAHHVRWQDVVCIVPMGVALGFLRYKSGSLLPSVLAHASFNAVAMGQLAMKVEDYEPPAAVLAGTAVLSALVLAGVVWLGRRSEAAEAARLEDVS